MSLPFLQSLSGLFGKPKDCLGVDIGTTAIKIADVSREGGRFRLKNYGILESYSHLSRVSGAIQTSSMQIVDKESVGLLKLLLQRMKPSTKSVVASIPNYSGFMTLLELPDMSEKELIKAIGYQAREHIPLPIEDVAIDWYPVGTATGEGATRRYVLLIAIPSSLIANYQNIFEAAGLHLTGIELDSVALVRSAISGDPTPTALIDIGSRATTIAIADDGALRMTFNCETAGSDISQAIIRSLRVNSRRAEELKRTRGLQSKAGEEELSSLMMPLLDAVVSEAQRGIRIYEEKTGRHIERVMLAGGTAALPNLVPYYSAQFKIPVVVASPLSRFAYRPELEPLMHELNPVLAVAAGLAIRAYS